MKPYSAQFLVLKKALDLGEEAEIKSLRLTVAQMQLPNVESTVPRVWTQHECAVELLQLSDQDANMLRWFVCSYRWLPSGEIWLQRGTPVDLLQLHTNARKERALKKLKRSLLRPAATRRAPHDSAQHLRAQASGVGASKVVKLPSPRPGTSVEACTQAEQEPASSLASTAPPLPFQASASVDGERVAEFGRAFQELAEEDTSEEHSDSEDDDVLLVQETWRDAQNAYEQRQTVQAREAAQPRVLCASKNPRTARSQHWGCPPWSVAKIYRNIGERQQHVGWGATCGCHSDHQDARSQQLICKKALFASATVSLDDARCLVKAWLLRGLTISRHAPAGRTEHVAVNARSLTYESEAALDAAAMAARAPV